MIIYYQVYIHTDERLLYIFNDYGAENIYAEYLLWCALVKLW